MGEKPFECDICEKIFISSGALTDHKRVHTGEKLYECVICKRAFILSSHLTVQKRVHTGEKPYSCDVCQKYFAQSSTLSNHNKTVAHIERMKSKNIIIPLAQSSSGISGENHINVIFVKIHSLKEVT